MNIRLEYAPGEVPPYALCEPATAGPTGRWHIRPVKDRLWLGGGVDTPSLCGRVDPTKFGGWDLNVRLEAHLEGKHICPQCRTKYRLLTGK